LIFTFEYTIHASEVDAIIGFYLTVWIVRLGCSSIVTAAEMRSLFCYCSADCGSWCNFVQMYMSLVFISPKRLIKLLIIQFHTSILEIARLARIAGMLHIWNLFSKSQYLLWCSKLFEFVSIESLFKDYSKHLHFEHL